VVATDLIRMLPQAFAAARGTPASDVRISA